jgi:hypothetical protein
MFEALPAVERVAFQHHSTLAQSVISACQSFLNWVESTRPMFDGKIQIATNGRLHAAKKYADEVFAPQLQKILITELNLHVKVNCLEDRVFNCAMFPAFRNVMWDEFNIGADLYSGTDSYKNTPFDPKLFDTDTSVNLTTGRFTKKSDNYVMMLFLFVYTFIGKEGVGGVEPWTAEEHAAVILHECGHGFGMFEHMADVYYKADMAGNSVRYLNDLKDDKTVLSTIANLETAVNRQSDAEWAKEIDTIIAEIKSSQIPAKNFNPVVAYLVLVYLSTLLATMFTRLIDAGAFGAINANINKSSDTVVTQSNKAYNERIADEFVSRHGLGAALATALSRMQDGYTRSALNDAIHNSVVASAFVTAFTGILSVIFGVAAFVDDGVYDPLWLRIDHIVKNNMVVFKDESLSPELRSYFIQETTELRKTLESIKSSKVHQMNQLLWGTLLRITNRGSILDGLRTASLSRDYDILQQLTNGLIKNPLYFHAARLKNL